MACSDIIIQIYYALIYYCEENVDKYVKTAGRCELKGSRYIDYSKASLTTMETNARMLYVILA